MSKDTNDSGDRDVSKDIKDSDDRDVLNDRNDHMNNCCINFQALTCILFDNLNINLIIIHMTH